MVSNNTPIIIDFGLAKVEGASELTSLHNIVGTAAYIAPEQASAREVDGRADLYSLGVILYESLTGQLPFKGETLKLIKNHGELTPNPPISINPSLDIELNALIIRLLRKDPDERYQSSKELANEITRIINRMEGGPPRENGSLRNLLSSF
jgi:serine/threonine-protein kinase